MAKTTIFTRYAEARILNAVFRGVAIVPVPGNWYVGLMKLKDGVDPAVLPGRDDVVEVPVGTFPSYARKALGATTLTEPASPGIPLITNGAQILFDEAQEAWGMIVALGVFDGAAGGNLWTVTPSAVADRRTVRVGDRIAIPANEVKQTGYDGTI